LSVVRLAKAPPRQPPSVQQRPERRSHSQVRLIAASLAIVGLALWFAGLAADVANRPALRQLASWLTKPAAAGQHPADGLPDDKALLSLASLNLPASCLPLTHRPVSREHAAEIARAMAGGSLEKLRCCTECHHAGQAKIAEHRSPMLASVAMQNCQACHRGNQET
jgi:hypothetical protein